MLVPSPSSSLTFYLEHLICLLPLLFYWNSVNDIAHSYFFHTVLSISLIPPSSLPFQGCSLWIPSTFSFQWYLFLAADSPKYISSLDHHPQGFILMALIATGHLHLELIKGSSNSSSPKWNPLISSKSGSLLKFITQLSRCSPELDTINSFLYTLIHLFPLILTPEHMSDPLLCSSPNISHWNHDESPLSGLLTPIFPLPCCKNIL